MDSAIYFTEYVARSFSDSESRLLVRCGFVPPFPSKSRQTEHVLLLAQMEEEPVMDEPVDDEPIAESSGGRTTHNEEVGSSKNAELNMVGCFTCCRCPWEHVATSTVSASTSTGAECGR